MFLRAAWVVDLWQGERITLLKPLELLPGHFAFTDAEEYLNQFGTPPEARGDTDHDGDFDDIPGLVDLLGGGSTAGLRSVPEPSTGLCLVLGIVACLGYSRWRRGR